MTRFGRARRSRPLADDVALGVDPDVLEARVAEHLRVQLRALRLLERRRFDLADSDLIGDASASRLRARNRRPTCTAGSCRSAEPRSAARSCAADADGTPLQQSDRRQQERSDRDMQQEILQEIRRAGAEVAAEDAGGIGAEPVVDDPRIHRSEIGFVAHVVAAVLERRIRRDPATARAPCRTCRRAPGRRTPSSRSPRRDRCRRCRSPECGGRTRRTAAPACRSAVPDCSDPDKTPPARRSASSSASRTCRSACSAQRGCRSRRSAPRRRACRCCAAIAPATARSASANPLFGYITVGAYVADRARPDRAWRTPPGARVHEREMRAVNRDMRRHPHRARPLVLRLPRCCSGSETRSSAGLTIDGTATARACSARGVSPLVFQAASGSIGAGIESRYRPSQPGPWTDSGFAVDQMSVPSKCDRLEFS